jgi:hypothetical protein
MRFVEDPSPGIVALRARVLASAAASPSPTRREGRRGFRVLVAVSTVAEFAVFQLAGGLAHSRERPLLVTAWLAGGWALGAATMGWLTARLSSPLVRDAEVLGLACATVPLALWALTVQADGLYAEPPSVAAAPCLLAALAGAAVLLGAFLRARRGSEPKWPAVLGAAGGCAASVWAGIPVLVWCPSSQRAHALLAHVAPIVASTLAGAMLGASLLGMRGPPRS